MKVVLLCTKLPPSIAMKFGEKSSPYGGWLEGISENLSNLSDIQVNYVMLKRGKQDKITKLQVEAILYQLIEYTSNQTLESNFPIDYDICHVFGTEQPFMSDCLSFLSAHKLVVSIQGLISSCATHYYGNYTMYAKSLNSFLKIYMKLNKLQFEKRGKTEKKFLSQVQYCIGRTDWDEQAVKLINPSIQYFSCNEIVRDSFYFDSWNLNTVEQYSIFVSQAGYPIKAPHMILETVRILKQKIPQVKCYIAGDRLDQVNTLANKLHCSYDYFIQQKIKEYNLSENIVFLGLLSEAEMKQKMLQCHCYYLASSLENSSNSLAEAMLLGMPAVASFVGGTSNLAQHNKTAYLYPYDEPSLAAYYLEKLMTNDDLALTMSLQAKNFAQEAYSQKKNTLQLLSVYKSVIGAGK